MTLRPLSALISVALALAATAPVSRAAPIPPQASDLDGLASASDPVRAESGRLISGTGAPLRPWGLALTASPPLVAPLPPDVEPETDPAASAFLRRLETLGIGFLRLEMPAIGAPGEEDALRAIDRVLARARAHGIHVWMGASRVLGFATSNDVVVLDDPASAELWARAFADCPDGRLPLDGCLARAWDPRLELLETERFRERVGHFNPVTGRRWADSPAVALWELEGPDAWHVRMAAGEYLAPPPTSFSFSFLDEQLNDWLYERRKGDGGTVQDPVSDRERAVFHDGLWTSHKRRLADALRRTGTSLQQSPLAWRETTAPDIRPDASGYLLIQARPADLPAAASAIPVGELAVLRILPITDDTPPRPADVWRVLASASRFAAVAWDAPPPTNHVPTAFQAAFAVAGDLFRANAIAPDAAVWRHFPAADTIPLGDGPGAPVLSFPAEADAAAGFVRCLPDRRTLYLATDAASATLAIPADASSADPFWRRLPISYTVRDIDGSILVEEMLERLPRRLTLPPRAFRVDFALPDTVAPDARRAEMRP